MKSRFNLKLLLGALLVSGLAACGGGGGTSSAGASSGSLQLALTDAPACGGYSAVNVTIQKVRVHQSSSADPANPLGWSEIVLNPARRVNLLTLQNGLFDEFGQLPLPTGTYTQLRLVLADNSSNPLANSVVTAGGSEVPLKTPSGQQSGVKANINIDIAAGKMADFVIDFNACKSVVTAGNSGQYLLKPVVSVIPHYLSGVAGFVDAGLINSGAGVALQQDGMVVKATMPDGNGHFVLQPVAPGNYTLVLTAPGHATEVVTNVPVAAETVTDVNTATAPLNPPLALGSGVVDGSAPTDTLVRILQSLTGGPSVEVAGGFVDSTTLNYSFPLAIDAPLVAPYVAAPGPLVFAADTAAAAKYTVNASLSAYPDKTAVLPKLTASAPITTNFTFP